MESPANPYSTPAANLYGSSTSGAADAVASSTIAALAGTKPWVRFMSVLMWLMSGLMLAMSAFMFLLSATGAMKGMPNSNPALSPSVNAGIMLGTAIYYCIIAFVVIYPAVKLWKYANNIARVMASHSIVDLDAALNEQRRYWKFNGIMIIVAICLSIIAVIAVFAVVGSAAMKAGALPH